MEVRREKLYCEVDSQSCDSSGEQSSSNGGGGDRSSTSGAPGQPGSSGGVKGGRNRTLFLDRVKESQEAIQRGDFKSAIDHYTTAISLDPVNHILYSNRSAARVKLKDYKKALEDAVKARELDPQWAKAHYREGIALQLLSRHPDSLGAFASGLALDPNNSQLLEGLVDAALKSTFKDKFEPTYEQLKGMKLEKNAFILIAVAGQELLAAAHTSQAVLVLESALRVGTCSLKLRGSVFSALGSAYWSLSNTAQAISYMQQDLSVAKSLADTAGECRAHGNLGSAQFARSSYKEALTAHRSQLRLAVKLKAKDTAAAALSHLGHVYTAIGDFPNALASHKQCVLLVKQLGDKPRAAREIGAVGAVFAAMGEFSSALECHEEHLKMAREAGDRMEEARSLSNLGSAHHYRRDYDRAIDYHRQVLQVSGGLGDRSLESRAYAGLGHAARALGDHASAKLYHEQQLDSALSTRDKASVARACSNIGIVYQLMGKTSAALILHRKHLNLAKGLSDRASQGRAYGNMGNAHSALGQPDLAVKYHREELEIAREVCDRHSEAATHGNLAVAYQSLGAWDQALSHYNSHLNIARDLRDVAAEARALANIGNFYSVRGEFAQAVPFYQQHLQLAQELKDSKGEGVACHRLGLAHHALGAHRQAVRYHEQDLELAKELRDTEAEGRAYESLGFAYDALENYSQALECQSHFLKLAHEKGDNVKGKFRAMGNIGDILVKMGSIKEAVLLYTQQLKQAKAAEQSFLVATAYGNLGRLHLATGQHDQALFYHTQELHTRQEGQGDAAGECRAHASAARVHTALGQLTEACRCWEEMLSRAREARESGAEARACGGLGAAKLAGGFYDEAIGLFEQELATLERVTGSAAQTERGEALENLGACYEALGDYEEALKCYQQCLSVAQASASLACQNRAYRGLGSAHKALGNLQQSLVCYEKRLVVAHEMSGGAAKESAYGELGHIHCLLGNFEQAISCLEHQITLAQEQGSRGGEASACGGLGSVYQQMGEYERAVDYHLRDLRLSEELADARRQCHAHGNLGLSYESLGELDKALEQQESHLQLAANLSDRTARISAYSGLGRVHHALGHHEEAVRYLQQGLGVAEMMGQREDEAKIRHRLGLALWARGDLEDAQRQLYAAAELFEGMRREAHASSDYKLSLFDLQTASYQALQRVLVALGRSDDALVVAERGRTRAFVDFLLERQTGGDGMYGSVDQCPSTVAQVLAAVTKHKSHVLYYSVAAGYLYCWLISPDKGILKFHECSVSEMGGTGLGSDATSMGGSIGREDLSLSGASLSVLDQYVSHARESLGVESQGPSGSASSRVSSGVYSESDGETDSLLQHQLDEVSTSFFNQTSSARDSTKEGGASSAAAAGFLHMMNRNHAFNSSNYSLGSLISFSGSLGGLSISSRRTSSGAVGKGPVSVNATPRGPLSQGKVPLKVLYDLLIAPVEEYLPKAPTTGASSRTSPDLVLILEGDLYLVPFPVLRGGGARSVPSPSLYLYERFNLIASPSLTALVTSVGGHQQASRSATGALVVGNPEVPQGVREQWRLAELGSAGEEVRAVGDLLGVKPIVGAAATKECVLRNLANTEVIHIAAHIIWKLSSIVLSPPSKFSQSGSIEPFSGMRTDVTAPSHLDSVSMNSGSAADPSSIPGFDSHSFSDYLVTAADILNTRLHAKVVVLSSGHTDDRAARINSDGVVGLTRALLAAGAQCVLFSLWPVPAGASNALFKKFYSALLQGHSTSRALSEAIRSVQAMRQFTHPSNWSGWVLVGNSVRLSSKIALMGLALSEMLQASTRCREAMRLLHHLVEKALQRINQGIETDMYTTEESIESKASVPGWRDLLVAVGFRFEPGTLDGAAPAVFFPTSDPGERLQQCSNCLQALLKLPKNTLSPLTKLLHNPEAGESIIFILKDLISKGEMSQTKMRVRLWRVNGCHEFLASLGFDLVEVGQDEVTLRTGKSTSRPMLQYAVQTLLVLFHSTTGGGSRGGGPAGRTNSLSSSSSMESLNSSHSGSNTTTTSNVSKESSATPQGYGAMEYGDSSSSPGSSPRPMLALGRIPPGREIGSSLQRRSKGTSHMLSRPPPIAVKPHRSTSTSVDDAFRFGGPAGQSLKSRPSSGTLQRQRQQRRDSDGTPTDETSSVCSDPAHPNVAKSSPRHTLPRGALRIDTVPVYTSSPSDSDNLASPVAAKTKKNMGGLAAAVAARRSRGTSNASVSSLSGPSGKLAPISTSTPEGVPNGQVVHRTESESSNDSNSSSRTMTSSAGAKKDVRILARNIMADMGGHLHAVKAMQHRSAEESAAASAARRQENQSGVFPQARVQSQSVLKPESSLSVTCSVSSNSQSADSTPRSATSTPMSTSSEASSGTVVDALRGDVPSSTSTTSAYNRPVHASDPSALPNNGVSSTQPTSLKSNLVRPSVAPKPRLAKQHSVVFSPDIAPDSHSGKHFQGEEFVGDDGQLPQVLQELSKRVGSNIASALAVNVPSAKEPLEVVNFPVNQASGLFRHEQSAQAARSSQGFKSNNYVNSSGPTSKLNLDRPTILVDRSAYDNHGFEPIEDMSVDSYTDFSHTPVSPSASSSSEAVFYSPDLLNGQPSIDERLPHSRTNGCYTHTTTSYPMLNNNSHPTAAYVPDSVQSWEC